MSSRQPCYLFRLEDGRWALLWYSPVTHTQVLPPEAGQVRSLVLSHLRGEGLDATVADTNQERWGRVITRVDALSKILSSTGAD